MLAEGLALEGYRVLVFDLDPQAMASKVLIGITGLQEVAEQERTLLDLLKQFRSGNFAQLAQFVTTRASDLVELRDAPDAGCVDLIASNRELLSDLAALEAEIRDCYPDRRIDVTLAQLLKAGLDGLDASYDVILFDCPAGTEPLALVALRVSSHVIAPTNLEENSYSALIDFIRLIRKDAFGLAKQLSLHVLMTLFIANNPEQRRMLDQIQSDIYAFSAIPRPVPQMTAIQRAEAHPGPGSYRRAREKYGNALVEVHALASAIVERILKSGEHDQTRTA
jgi:cellulose biosynthesis protein BcsQ